MKRLNQNSSEIFVKLIGLMKSEQHLKIDNSQGSFMALSIEKLYDVSIVGRDMTCYSLSHYFSQNGDLVPDPDMTFFVHNLDSSFIYPATFQDQFSYREGLYQDGDKWYINKKEQADQTSFANMWLKNIKEQQDIQ